MLTITKPIYIESMFGHLGIHDYHTEQFVFCQVEEGWQWHTVNDESKYLPTYEECVQSAIEYTESQTFDRQEVVQDEYDKTAYCQKYGHQQRELV